MLEKRDVRIVRGGDLPLVLMADLGLDVARVAVEYAREWGWDLRAWWLSRFEWPTDKPVAGVLFGSALSDKLAKTFSLRDNIPAVRIGHHPHPDDALLPLAVPDRAVAQALRFIWDHFRENLSIQNIADSIDLPRRSLERRFRIHLNRSVHAELKRKRVTELRHLLLTTHEPIADVAPRAGFYTLTHANRVFREAYGESATSVSLVQSV